MEVLRVLAIAAVPDVLKSILSNASTTSAFLPLT